MRTRAPRAAAIALLALTARQAAAQHTAAGGGGFVARLAELMAPWQSLYADSAAVSSAVLFAHLGALLLGGGIAVAADRTTLRLGVPQAGDDDALGADRVRHARELATLHRPVVAALLVMLGSGVMLLLADVEGLVASPVLYVKIVLVALLLANGARLAAAERAVNAAPAGDATTVVDGWRRLRAASIASLVLWVATVLAGVVLSNV
ncbi:hypothetical protein [Roseisolibacter agri]|uniref:Copper resistance protein D n=1 Tax=Roseisolibacter agri TaxID=2014610 RepID=A0AA37VG30_9BACT|nr:hypothetical protein [Roseisolibacter agri]GLC27854.1 hypothetical protein rosag_43670 [Roseisolibacter agri]